jgi:AcrR family transcriptional regulator
VKCDGNGAATPGASRRGAQRRLLLEAAAAAFAEQGTGVSIAEIAQRAGMGKGTVFRHFPSKENLIAAVICARLDDLAAAGAALLDAADPTAALLEFMRLGAELQARDRSVCQAAIGVVHGDAEVQAAADRLTRTAEALTEQAQRHGGIRSDITGQDIILLLRGAYQAAAPLAHAAPDLWRRYLAVVIDGLRTATPQPLPGPVPGRSLPMGSEGDRAYQPVVAQGVTGLRDSGQ